MNNVATEGDTPPLSYYMALAHGIAPDGCYTKAHKRFIGVGLGHATLRYEVRAWVEFEMIDHGVARCCCVKPHTYANTHMNAKSNAACLHARTHEHAST